MSEVLLAVEDSCLSSPKYSINSAVFAPDPWGTRHGVYWVL